MTEKFSINATPDTAFCEAADDVKKKAKESDKSPTKSSHNPTADQS